MKKITVFILVCVIGALAMAAKEEIKSEDAKKPASQTRSGAQDQIQRPVPMRGREGNSSQQRQRGYQMMLARRAEMHTARIAELEAIRKIAKEEGAPRTIEAIQALITKKNNEYKEQTSRMEKQRQERARQIQQRPQKGSPQQTDKPKVTKPDASENKAGN